MRTKPADDGPPDSDPAAPRAKTPMGTVFLTVFLDIVGFSILFPLFPALLDHYVGLEGTESTVGRLASFLRELAGTDDHAVVAFFGGVLGALYSLLQFLSTPFWGGLSDRIGRRPTLLITVSGTLVAYLLWILAGSFSILIASRFLAGVMAGNISTATAVVADTTTPAKRAAGMGMVGMAIGLGFILGPAIGGATSLIVLGEGASGWSGGFALNPFSAPAAAAALLALLNLIQVARRLPETRPEEAAGGGGPRHSLNPLGAVARESAPGVARTTVIFFLYLCAFAAMEFTLSFLAVERFAYTARDIALFFVFVGFVIAFVQGGLVRRLAPRLGERKLALVGFVVLVPGLVVVAVAGGTGSFYTGLFLMSVGSALAMPSLSSLVSRYAPAERQGLVLGHFRAAGALARAVGPLAGGALYFAFGSAMPYWAAAGFLLLPILLTLGLPAPAAVEARTAA